MHVRTLQPSAFADFGTLLRALRLQRRLTQRELGLQVGYSETQISRLEQGKRLPDPAMVAALFLQALGLSEDPELATRLQDLARVARAEVAIAPFVPSSENLGLAGEREHAQSLDPSTDSDGPAEGTNQTRSGGRPADHSGPGLGSSPRLFESALPDAAEPDDPRLILIEALVPDPTPDGLLSALERGRLPAAPVSITFNQQVVTAVQSHVVQSIHGTVSLGLQARELLDLIARHGAEQASDLETAVYELEDPDAQPSDRRRARQRLREFLGRLAPTVQDVALDVLKKYLEARIGAR